MCFEKWAFFVVGLFFFSPGASPPPASFMGMFVMPWLLLPFVDGGVLTGMLLTQGWCLPCRAVLFPFFLWAGKGRKNLFSYDENINLWFFPFRESVPSLAELWIQHFVEVLISKIEEKICIKRGDFLIYVYYRAIYDVSIRYLGKIFSALCA